MKKIYGGIYSKKPSVSTDAFIVDEAQKKAEQLLIPYYLWETLAHNYMLAVQKIVPKKVAKKILSKLLEYLVQADETGFNIDPSIGDVHENFEAKLTADIGSDAGWFHTARSRNDQITTDQKLLVKQFCFDIFTKLYTLSGTLGYKSKRYASVLMPGITHTRVAMPSSFGFWWQSYLDELLTVEELFVSVLAVIDKNPLGAGASYGVNWPIDPAKTQQWMGFDKPLVNGLAAIDDRGIHELYLLGLFVGLMTVLSRMMEDIVLFSMPEIGYFSFDESFTTGSSIMPQKINPDIAEKVRAKIGTVLGCLVNTCVSLKGTPHGMNRDSAETKTAFIDAAKTVSDTLGIVEEMVATLVPNEIAMKHALAPALATKLVDSIVQTYNIPFRQAHEAVGKALKASDKDIQKITPQLLAECIGQVWVHHVAVTAEFLSKVLDLDGLLSGFSYIGSPNPKYVVYITKKLLIKNKKLAHTMYVKQKGWNQAKLQLINDVKMYMKKEGA
jgi:argininosuccinate lyase